MERIPLNQRFRLAESHNPNFLEAFDMKLSEYLAALSALAGGHDLGHISDFVHECLNEGKDHNIMVSILSETEYPEAEHEYALYKMLVEPFAIMADAEYKQEKDS